MRINKLSILSLVIGGSAMLAACGGNPTLSVSGTAATGLALDGATITATCKSGTGTATSNASGSYSVTILSGEGPCLIKAVKGTTALYSVSTGVGANQTANVTPLTNLFVTYLMNAGSGADTDADTWFAKPASRTFLSNTTTVTTFVTQFVNTVVALLPVGTTVPSTFLSAPMTPGSTADANDVALEALKGVVVNDSGAPLSDTVIQSIIDDANTQPVADGASGASGASGSQS